MILAVIIMNIRILKNSYSEFAIAFWGTAISCLLMTPFAFEPSSSVLASNISLLIAFGIVSVGIGGILTTIGFANLKSQTGSLLSLIEPVAGVFFDLAVLGVALSGGTVTGCLLVLVASAVVSYYDYSKTPVMSTDLPDVSKNI
jgi:drug/metabolite transporter (DMT)-like permease